MKLAILLSVMIGCITLSQAINSITQNKNKGNDDEDESTYISYDPKRSIKQVLSEYPGDFGSDLFQELLTRKDLAHLLLTDIGNLEGQIQKEFSDIIKINYIGKTWEARDISVIELDARKLVNSEKFKDVA